MRICWSFSPSRVLDACHAAISNVVPLLRLRPGKACIIAMCAYFSLGEEREMNETRGEEARGEEVQGEGFELSSA